MIRLKLFAGAALAAALVTAPPVFAKPGGDMNPAQQAIADIAEASQNGGETAYSMFPTELKSGALSAADNERLNDILIDNLHRLDEKWKREFARDNPGMMSSLGKLDQILADYRKDRADHGNRMTSDNVINVLTDAIPELIDQIGLRTHTEVSVMVDDMIGVIRTMITARSNMAGADPKRISEQMEWTYTVERKLSAFLYQSRDVMERISTAFREVTPAQRAAAAKKLQAAIDRGDITYDDDGNFKVAKPPPTPVDPTPAPAPDPANGPATSPARGPATNTSPTTDSPSNDASPSPSGDPALSATPKPVKRGTIPGAPDPAVMIPQATQDAYDQQQAAARQAAADQAAPPPTPQPQPKPTPRPVQPTTLDPTQQASDSGANQPTNSADTRQYNDIPPPRLDMDALRRARQMEDIRNAGDKANDTINFLSLSSIFSDDPELMSALTVAWQDAGGGATGSGGGVFGGLDSPGTLADQSGYDAFSTGPYTDPGGYGGALANGPYPTTDAAAGAGWATFDATSPVTVANLEPIYAGYDVNAQPGAAMQSLDLHAPVPSAVMTVPSTQVNVPSQVMGPGTLPGAMPELALCGR